MNIQSSTTNTLFGYLAEAQAARQTSADPAAMIVDSATISQAAKDKLAASQSTVLPDDQMSHFRDIILRNAASDPAFAKKFAQDYAYDASYETTGPLVDIGAKPGDPKRYHYTKEIVTDSNVAAFKTEAVKVREGRVALYEAEKTKGTPDKDILDKLFNYTDKQSDDYLGKTGWIRASATPTKPALAIKDAYGLLTTGASSDILGSVNTLLKGGHISLKEAGSLLAMMRIPSLANATGEAGAPAAANQSANLFAP